MRKLCLSLALCVCLLAPSPLRADEPPSWNDHEAQAAEILGVIFLPPPPAPSRKKKIFCATLVASALTITAITAYHLGKLSGMKTGLERGREAAITEMAGSLDELATARAHQLIDETSRENYLTSFLKLREAAKIARPLVENLSAATEREKKLFAIAMREKLAKGQLQALTTLLINGRALSKLETMTLSEALATTSISEEVRTELLEKGVFDGKVYRKILWEVDPETGEIEISVNLEREDVQKMEGDLFEERPSDSPAEQNPFRDTKPDLEV